MPLINARVREMRWEFSIKSQYEFEFKADRMFRHIRKNGHCSIYYEPIMAFLQIISDLYLQIYVCAIDRISFKKYLPLVKPEAIAFGSVAVSIAEWLHTLEPPEGALCLADHSRTELEWESEMERISQNGFVIRNPNDDSLIIDIPILDYFAYTMLIQHSKKSIWLQMADFANFFYKTHMMKQMDAEPFYEIISPLFKMGGIFYAYPKDCQNN
jgi:hypothetical protein